MIASLGGAGGRSGELSEWRSRRDEERSGRRSGSERRDENKKLLLCSLHSRAVRVRIRSGVNGSALGRMTSGAPRCRVGVAQRRRGATAACQRHVLACWRRSECSSQQLQGHKELVRETRGACLRLDLSRRVVSEGARRPSNGPLVLLLGSSILPL